MVSEKVQVQFIVILPPTFGVQSVVIEILVPGIRVSTSVHPFRLLTAVPLASFVDVTAAAASLFVVTAPSTIFTVVTASS